MRIFTRAVCDMISRHALLVLTLIGASQALGQEQNAETARDKQLTPKEVKDLDVCSLTRTNSDCKYIIDRKVPVVPTQIQMFSNQRLTVVVKRPQTFERYFLDPVSGQVTLYPDTTATIVQGMLPSLAKINLYHSEEYGLVLKSDEDFCAAKEITGDRPAKEHVADVVSAFRKCFAKLAKDAKSIYSELEPYTAPDALTVSDYSLIPLKTIAEDISKLAKSETAMSSRISGIAGSSVYKDSTKDEAPIAELSSLQKPADAVAADLLGYSLRIRDLEDFSNGSTPCSDVIDLESTDDKKMSCVSVSSHPDSDVAYKNMVTRTITYSVDTYNLVSYSQQAAVDATKKKALGGNLALNFADSPSKHAIGSTRSPLRWEASAGVFFSSLPIRSYAVTPVFNGTTVTDNKVSQTTLGPTVVPYAAGNYRISNDLRWTKWKSNLYLTGGVGVNPNTVSADFAAGLSLSWRTLMLSPLWHYGHETELAPGFSVGESLGADFKSALPTQNVWKSSFAFGIGVRIPPITGR